MCVGWSPYSFLFFTFILLVSGKREESPYLVRINESGYIIHTLSYEEYTTHTHGKLNVVDVDMTLMMSST